MVSESKAVALIAAAYELGVLSEQGKCPETRTQAQIKKRHLVVRFTWPIKPEDPFSARAEAFLRAMEDALSDQALCDLLSQELPGSILRGMAAEAGRKRRRVLEGIR